MVLMVLMLELTIAIINLNTTNHFSLAHSNSSYNNSLYMLVFILNLNRIYTHTRSNCIKYLIRVLLTLSTSYFTYSHFSTCITLLYKVSLEILFVIKLLCS